MKAKRILLMGDFHCGHGVGLTPPHWQIRTPDCDEETTKRPKMAALQRECWQRFDAELRACAPYDALFFLGDAIDGKGDRWGGSEQITTDREEQSNMAVAVFDHTRLYARRGFKIVGVYGTPYHVGREEDWENIIAQRAGFEKIGAHEWPDVNGCIFDLKHHVGSSRIPHGRHTATAADMVWNTFWAEADLQPRATIIVRAHVHYHQLVRSMGRVGMTLPALQAMGSKFGSRMCSGLVDWGFVVADIGPKGEIVSIDARLSRIESQQARTVRI